MATGGTAIILDDSPPPAEHILRPHHIGLLAILMIQFKEFDNQKLPVPFTLHLYRLLINEISEITQPKPHQEILEEISSGPRADADESKHFLAALRLLHSGLTDTEQLNNFFGNIPSLFIDKSATEPPTFMRRSLFGYFCRRCFVTFLKLSFSGVAKFQDEYQAWRAGQILEGGEYLPKEQLGNADLILFKTHADKKSWATSQAYGAWEKAQATGDEVLASENLRRFFEQHFHEHNDSGLRQHALLNLVRMHYIRGEFVAARKLLSEAITVARTSGDRMTLQHCISLSHRLPQKSPAQRPDINELQPDLHPLEVLFDVQKLLVEENDQPVSASFVKIFEAVGLYDHWVDIQLATPAEAEQWAQHVLQAITFNTAGCNQIGAIEEDIVMAFTVSGAGDNNRITVMLNKAYKQARQGDYERSLSMLLDPGVWRGLSIHEHTSWAVEIWNILALRAARRGQDRVLREFLLPRQIGPVKIKEYIFDESRAKMSRTRALLYEIMEMRQCGQATTMIEQLLTALWHSEFLFHMDLYRSAAILLADVGLEFGMSKRCQRILDEVMPQIIIGNDVEQRAVACFTLARCMVVDDNSPTTLETALTYLKISEADFRKLQMMTPLMETQYLISVMYHNLGLEAERDAAAARYFQSEEEKVHLAGLSMDDEARQVLEVVMVAGAALADR